MDKKLKKIIIEAFECGAKWNKQKGHYLNALDFIEENKKQLNLYSVVKQSELLKTADCLNALDGWELCKKQCERCKMTRGF